MTNLKTGGDKSWILSMRMTRKPTTADHDDGSVYIKGAKSIIPGFLSIKLLLLLLLPHRPALDRAIQCTNSSTYPRLPIFLQRKLGDELGRILLPLLVVLSVAVSLVIFALGKWHTAHLEHQEGREQRADEGK